jgi:peptidoglycan/xylan/chitin deacetylase (PgdA/CDA1 family)
MFARTAAAGVLALVVSASASGGGTLRLPDPLPARTVVLPILMYHRVGPINPALPAVTKTLTVSPADFAAQMHWIVAHGYNAVSPLQAFEALEYGKPLPSHPVLITFDDGYRDVLWNAAPVLHRLHLPAVEFVITGRISNGDPSFLTWPELTRLEKLGVTIGSHTVTHQDLVLMPSSQAWTELHDSRSTLEQHLGHPVQWFAYPFGAENAGVVALVAKAGYVMALTTQGGVAQSADAPYLLHREEVTDTAGPNGLSGILG